MMYLYGVYLHGMCFYDGFVWHVFVCVFNMHLYYEFV